jgi:hypothetical protein
MNLAFGRREALLHAAEQDLRGLACQLRAHVFSASSMKRLV